MKAAEDKAARAQAAQINTAIQIVAATISEFPQMSAAELILGAHYIATAEPKLIASMAIAARAEADKKEKTKP